MIESADIVEFRTNWNDESFFKHRLLRSTAKRLIRKSISITQGRMCRHLKLVENDLTDQLKLLEQDRLLLTEFCQSNSFADHLDKRLLNLQNEIQIYSQNVQSLVKKEKDHWKQLERIVARRIHQ